MHDALILEFQAHGEDLLRRCDDLKKFLGLVIGNLGTQSDPRWQSEKRDARALSAVCVMAELEALTKFLIQETHAELNNSGLSINRLRPSLRQLAAHNTFESLRELSDHSKLWEKRRYATTLDGCGDTLVLPSALRTSQPPLDGKTLKPEHFNRIWEIYGLPESAFPVSSWSASLQKMALFRNDVAHANLPYLEIFQQAGRSVQDVERYVNDIDEFAIHLVAMWIEYLQKQRYLA